MLPKKSHSDIMKIICENGLEGWQICLGNMIPVSTTRPDMKTERIAKAPYQMPNSDIGKV
jgi:hypothetical protein